jgi:hypothetical protein
MMTHNHDIKNIYKGFFCGAFFTGITVFLICLISFILQIPKWEGLTILMIPGFVIIASIGGAFIGMMGVIISGKYRGALVGAIIPCLSFFLLSIMCLYGENKLFNGIISLILISTFFIGGIMGAI